MMLDEDTIDEIRRKMERILHKEVRQRKEEISDCVIITTDDAIKVARQYSFPSDFNWYSKDIRRKIADIVTVEEGLLVLALNAVKDSAGELNLKVDVSAEIDYHNAPNLKDWLLHQGTAVSWHNEITRTYTSNK